MNLSKAQFRWLLTASILFPILGVVVTFAGESSLPAPLREYVTAQGNRELSVTDWLVVRFAIPIIILAIVSTIGLYLFWPFARPLSLIVTAAGLVLEAFSGPVVESGFATALYELGTILSGAILAIIYLTPATAWFQRPTKTTA